MGLDISMVAGTSVGALNGAMVVQGDIDRAFDIWHDLNPELVIKLTRTCAVCSATEITARIR